MFSTGRMLYNLALQNNGPKVFGKISKTGTPSTGILFSSAMLLVGVVLNYLVPAKVFEYVSSVATVAMLTAWTIILLSELKFRKLKNSQKQEIAFKLPFWPVSSYIALVFIAVIVVIMAFMPETRTALYVAPVWFLILYIGYKLGPQRSKREGAQPE